MLIINTAQSSSLVDVAPVFTFALLLFGVICGACFLPAAPVDAARNVNSTTAVDSQTSATDSKSQINLRQKPRRKNIRFPPDCLYTAGESARENSCAAWLEKASRTFPADADCDYDQIRQPDNSVDLIRFNETFANNAVEFYRLSAGKHLV